MKLEDYLLWFIYVAGLDARKRNWLRYAVVMKREYDRHLQALQGELAARGYRL